MLRITAVCNAGLVLEFQDHCILIDGTAYDYLGFTGMEDRLLQELGGNTGSFAPLCGVFATHCHPDHYDAARTAELMAQIPGRTCFVPDENTPVYGCIHCGPFSVYYHETEHMPHTYAQVRHYVLLVVAGNETVYIAADAKLDAQMHRNILRDLHPTYAVVNPVYLTSSEMIPFLRDLSPRNLFIYHVPGDPADRTGMRRKAERSMARCAEILPPMTLADAFPRRLL